MYLSFIKNRWKWFTLFILIVLGTSIGLKQAVIPDNSLKVWFLQDDPLLKNYQKFHDHFGNDEVIIIALDFKRNVFNTKDLKKIKKITELLKSVSGIDQVTSITNVQNIYDINDEIFFDKLLPDDFIKYDEKDLKLAHERSLNNPLINNRLINAKGDVTLIWAQMQKDIDVQRDKIVDAVKTTVNTHLTDETVHFGGVGIIYSALNKATTHDFGLFILISYIMMIIFLKYAFRNLKLIIAAMSVISVGTIFTLGLYGICGNHLNMVTVMLPTLVAILGIADAIHFPSAFITIENDNPTLVKKQVALLTLKKVFTPCLLTTITTMAGFLALTSSPMAVIQQLGFYAAWGIGVSLIASLLFMVIAYLSINENVKLPQSKFINQLLDFISLAFIKQKRWPLIVCLLVTLIGVIGIFRLNIDTLTIGYLPDNNKAVTDHHAIEKKWGNYNILELLVMPKRNLKADDIKILNATEQFTEEVNKLPEIQYSISIMDLYRRVEHVFRGELPPQGPMMPATAAQLKLIIDSGSQNWDRTDPNFNENIVAPFVNIDKKVGRITFVADMLSAKEIDKVLTKVNNIAKKYFTGIAEIKASGYVPLYVKIIDYILGSQLKSLFIALSVIFFIMLFWLKSVRLSLIGIIPNIFPVVIMFGIMGILKINLDIATATIAAIVMGVSIDDTIHFLYYWSDAEKSGKSFNECLKYTFSSCGRAAITTSILLVLGYSVMIFAEVKSVQSFGSLTAMAAFFALIGDLLLLPILLRFKFPN
jgi:uncharacterized protein